jgi:hypothetical protein
VGDEDGGQAQLALDRPQGQAQLEPDLGVQGAEGFVQEQHLRLVGQGARQSHPLLLPPESCRG